MRRFLGLMILLVLAPVTLAGMWTTVYRCDEETPLAAADPNHPTLYRDIMVGTRLVLVVSSDTAGHRLGDLLFAWDDEPDAALTGRGFIATLPGSTAKIPNYKDSCLPAAGRSPRAFDYQNPTGFGLEFYSHSTAVPGDWFIFDYHARQVGTCDIGLYDVFSSRFVPIETLSFTHVPSRDFNGDARVDFQDLALLAARWDSSGSLDPNDPSAAFDLDGDATIAFSDLALFSEYWLERTDCRLPGDPNHLSPGL